jgi:hypothetical protein
VVGNAVVVFADYPDQWRLLQQDRSKIGAAVEELLRYESASQYKLRYSLRRGDVLRRRDVRTAPPGHRRRTATRAVQSWQLPLRLANLTHAYRVGGMPNAANSVGSRKTVMAAIPSTPAVMTCPDSR